ncbi:hypothetical protein GCM10023115_24820 [Pontixanthobacter gangjinensis]|uniref:Uncharacterized protein n=1 Tax=Christiangramia aestuarii TaxID=1028746 RepID=A0A7K1LSU5_9FLAO|nr:hypothetical protein [Christiangramia aestuarii]MUP43885.1 hypothetical protein [Christiangramia aestuarii]
MAHLTNYTYSRLCRKLEIKQEVDLQLFLDFVYNDPQVYYILNKFEVNYLFNYKALLEDEDRFYAEYYQEVPERIDSKTYVFESGGKLKYHLTNECRLITKDFIDFNIPPEIRELGEEVVEEYRDWFKEKGFADQYFQNKLDKSLVVFNYNMKFPPKYKIPVLNENYELIKKIPNSNNLVSDNSFDKQDFLNKMDVSIKQYYNMFSCKTTRIISKFDYLRGKSDAEIREKMTEVFSPNFVDNYGIKNLKEKFTYSRKIKLDIISNLLEFFRWNFNLKEKDFKKITLENFGLECCNSCSKEKLATTTVNRQ